MKSNVRNIEEKIRFYAIKWRHTHTSSRKLHLWYWSLLILVLKWKRSIFPSACLEFLESQKIRMNPTYREFQLNMQMFFEETISLNATEWASKMNTQKGKLMKSENFLSISKFVNNLNIWLNPALSSKFCEFCSTWNSRKHSWSSLICSCWIRWPNGLVLDSINPHSDESERTFAFEPDPSDLSGHWLFILGIKSPV